MSMELQPALLHHALGRLRIPKPAQVLASAYIKEHKASDQLISLNGSNVSAWPCGANNGSLIQGTAGTQPPYSATSFNGGPGVSGTSTRWIKGTITNAIASGTRVTVWLVFKFGSDNGKTVFSTFGSLGSLELHNIGNTNMIMTSQQADGGDSVTGPAKDTSVHLMRLQVQSGSAVGKVKVDDTSYDGTKTGTLANQQTTLSLFSDNGSRIGNSTIAHFVMMLGEPSASQETAMRTYFRYHPDCLYYGLTHTP